MFQTTNQELIRRYYPQVSEGHNASTNEDLNQP